MRRQDDRAHGAWMEGGVESDPASRAGSNRLRRAGAYSISRWRGRIFGMDATAWTVIGAAIRRFWSSIGTGIQPPEIPAGSYAPNAPQDPFATGLIHDI